METLVGGVATTAALPSLRSLRGKVVPFGQELFASGLRVAGYVEGVPTENLLAWYFCRIGKLEQQRIVLQNINVKLLERAHRGRL